jgi:hypothetical protein
MSIVETEEELVEIGELKGREVCVYLKDLDEAYGILHSITNHGVLIKLKGTGDYEMYPWWQIKAIAHFKNEEIKEETVEEISEDLEENSEDWEPVIVRTEKSIIQDAIPESYDWDWEDEDVLANVYNDEGETAIEVDLDAKDIKVYYEKDLDLAKSLAKELKYKKIIRDYQE